jgi:hypothetical protein
MGGLKRSAGTRGFLLLDALMATGIAAVGLAVLLGSLGMATRMVMAQRARVLHLIEQENGETHGPSVYVQER